MVSLPARLEGVDLPLRDVPGDCCCFLVRGDSIQGSAAHNF